MENLTFLKSIVGGIGGAFIGMLLFMLISNYMIYLIWFVIGGAFGGIGAGTYIFIKFRENPPRGRDRVKHESRKHSV